MQKGDRFESLDAARNAVKAFVLDQGESFTTVASDKKRYIIRCKDKACEFRIRATLHKKASETPTSITRLIPHSCSPAVHYKSKQSQSVEYLAAHHRASVIDNRNITVAQIRSNERLQFNSEISYKQAYRTKQALLRELDGDEDEAFAKIPALCQRIQAADKDNYVVTKWSNGNSGKFEAIFVAPVSTRHAQWYLRPFIGLDSAHTKSKYRMQLFIACSVDANDRALPLAWALVPIENKYWWTWFCMHLKNAFNIEGKEGFVIMSDREKGLTPAVEEVFSQAKHSYCCQHIADNVAVSFGNKCRPFFWRCARAKTSDAFFDALKALYKESSSAGQYIEHLEHTTWTRYAFPFPRYGHDTNNVNESINNAWLDIRRLPPLQMIDAIYTYLMKTVHDRNKEPQRSTELADVPLAKFNERLRSSRRFRVFESGDGIYQVQIPDTGVKYVTNLRKRECSCTYFWDYSSPCTHAITALRYEAEDPFLHFAQCYYVKTLHKTYERFLVPFSIQDLPSSIGCYPPEYKKQPGRPRTKRIRKGASKRKPTTCGNCGQKGQHNKRTCRSAPKHTRQERAQDRDISSGSTSTSESDSDKSEDGGSNKDSLNSELVQEREWQAEIDRYDFVIARAVEVVERRRQEEIEDNDIIDSQSDVQGNQDCQSDSIDNASSRASQGVGISPRRTRSGIILKRIEN
jgi:hypothetical protein